MFLVGKAIPSHITSLPETVLNTPFGQMLRPQLENSMRGITQAPVAQANIPHANGMHQGQTAHGGNGSVPAHKDDVPGVVYHPSKLQQLDELLASAKNTCAVIFFTSATCPPCKIVYPAYDELAAAAGAKATLIKVDLSESYEIGAKYQVRVTPTFMTFLKGEKENEWTGANESQLRGNVNLLLQMANPAHPHTHLRVHTLQRHHNKPVTYPKVPPLEKLVAKLGDLGRDPAVVSLNNFNSARSKSGAADAPLPTLPDISNVVIHSVGSLPPENLFPLIDLFRLAMIDPRFSGYFAQSPRPIQTLFFRIRDLDDKCPYQLRIVTLHLACNLFTSPLFPTKLLTDEDLSTSLFYLVTSSLLDAAHVQIRVVAAQLAFNIAAVNHAKRLDHKPELLSEGHQIELMASLLEALRQESESVDVVRGLLLSVGLLKYLAPQDGELSDLCEAVGAKDLLGDARAKFKDLDALAKEVQLVM